MKTATAAQTLHMPAPLPVIQKGQARKRFRQDMFETRHLLIGIVAPNRVKASND